MIQSAGKVMDNPSIFAANQKNNEEQSNGSELRDNFFIHHSHAGVQNLQGSSTPINNQQQNITNSGIQQVKRISNCNSINTPQQKVIKKQFSKSKDRNSSLTSSNNNPQTVSSTVNNISNNTSNIYQNNQSTQNNQNNVSGYVNQQVNTLGCSTVNDSAIYTPSCNALGYSTNPQLNQNNNNSNTKKGATTAISGTNFLHSSVVKSKDPFVLRDTTNMVGNQNSQMYAVPSSNNNSVNKNQYSSVPNKQQQKEFSGLEYTLQPHRQSLLFKNSENIDPRTQSHLVSTQSERKNTSERTNYIYYNLENKIPTQSDNLSTTKELDQEGQQHLRNVDNYQISTKCLNDLNSNNNNSRSRPFSLFTKKQEDYDISQNCDQSVIPQETSNSNGVSQTFQNNQRYKQSLPSTRSHQLFLNNENNYQTQFRDLLDWKIEGSKIELNNSNDQINCENNSTDLSNKPTANNLRSDKKFKNNCECLKEIAELKIMISEMQKNQIIQSQINQKLQQDNENLWKTISSFANQQPKNKEGNSFENDETKDNLAGEKENAKQQNDKSKYSKIVKSLVNKNKELKKQNNEMEAVLKDILLQNEISRQRIGIRDKLSTKNSRPHSRSGIRSNNETEFIFDNQIQNLHYDGNNSQNYHVYRPRSSSNSQFASGANSSKRGNENKQQKSTPYQNILKKANTLHENIEVLKQDSLILNQVGINLNTQQSNDAQHHQYTPPNENYGSINNDEQDNSNDTKIRQILSKIHQHNTLQNS